MPVSKFRQLLIGEKQSPGRSRVSNYLSQETADRIELTSHWFHFWPHPVLPLSSTNTSPIQTQSAFEEIDRLQTSDFGDIYLNRIAEKLNHYLSVCVPVDQ